MPDGAQTTPKRALFAPEDHENMRWFWRRYLRKRLPALLGVFAMILAQGLVYQQFLARTEDGLRIIFESGTVRQLLLVCAGVFGLFAFRALLSWLIPRLSVRIASDAVREMRGDIVEHLVRLDLAWFEARTPGEVIQRLVNQTQALASFVGQGAIKALRDAATIVILSAYLMWKQPILFTAALVVLPVIVMVMQRVSQSIRTVQKRSQRASRGYMDAVGEMVTGMRTVKIAGQEAAEKRRLDRASDDIRDLAVELNRNQVTVLPFVDLASAFVYALVIGGGGYMVLSPAFDVDGAAILAFLLGLVLIFDPGRRLAQFVTSLQAAVVQLASVRELHAERPRITDREGAGEAFDAAGDITFEAVRFSYGDEGPPLFDGLSMTFEGGRTTAIVGPTGSGKTTILSLLARLYEVDGGAVRIGGTDIRELRIAALRRAFSVVAQDIVIFDGSIEENIRYVRQEASEAEVRAAAEAAEIAGLMDERAGASVGPRGGQLSGGQKQRIAIARAVLRGAPIVLLDEATSALDQRTEAKVTEALGRMAAGRTTIMVAHRLSTVAGADRIYVLEGGAVAEMGTHAELMERGGLYASLYAAQRSAYAG